VNSRRDVVARSLPGALGKETTVMLMLVWLENHLIVLGFVAIVVGLGLGAVLGRAQGKAGRISDSRRRSAGRVSPRSQTRSW
jgi:hypothetical protein